MDCVNEQMRGKKREHRGGERVFRVKLMSGSGGEARRRSGRKRKTINQPQCKKW